MYNLYLDNRDTHTLFSKLSSKLLKFYRKYPAIFPADESSITLCNYLSYSLKIPILKELNNQKFIWVINVFSNEKKLNEFIEKTNLVQGKDFVVASLHRSKNLNGVYPNIYINTKKSDQWIVYPW